MATGTQVLRSSRWFAFVLVVMERDGKMAVLKRWFDSRDLVPINSRPQSPDPRRWHQGWIGELGR